MKELVGLLKEMPEGATVVVFTAGDTYGVAQVQVYEGEVELGCG